MTPVLLTKIKTSDGLTLEGIAVLPKKKSDTALIWLHGLSSSFSRGQTLTCELSSQCTKNNIGYFKFNTRGHDIASRSGKNIIGAGFEKFEECVLDIHAMIRFAHSLGFKKIILAGHSTGANKALYYVYKTRDKNIKGILLIGPISDVSTGLQTLGKKGLLRGISLAKSIIKKKDAMMPSEYGILTPQRFLSLYHPGSKEDVFPYHTEKALWKELKSIRIPIAIIVGARDEYLDRPAKKLVEVFKKYAPSTPKFTGITIQGANHGFAKKEEELSEKIINFISKK